MHLNCPAAIHINHSHEGSLPNLPSPNPPPPPYHAFTNLVNDSELSVCHMFVCVCLQTIIQYIYSGVLCYCVAAVEQTSRCL